MYTEGVKAYLYLGFKKFDIIVCFIQHRHYIHLQFVMTRHAIILKLCFLTDHKICDHEKQHIRRNHISSYMERKSAGGAINDQKLTFAPFGTKPCNVFSLSSIFFLLFCRIKKQSLQASDAYTLDNEKCYEGGAF